MTAPIERARFDHVALIGDRPRPGETWIEEAGVWATSPRAHPFQIEWLRFARDSPMPAQVRERTHVAFRVDDLEAAIAGQTVISDPQDVGGLVRVAFIEVDGAVVELMQWDDPQAEGWF